VHIVAFALRKALPDKMPPIAGRVHRHVAGTCGGRAFQHRLEGIEIVAFLSERQVVDEQYEL